jgi:chemotaxis protein CheD
MAELEALAAAAAAPAGAALRLAQLRARARRPGEASMFWIEARLRRVAVRLLPGEYFVSLEDMPIMTTLGSCIACCLWDRVTRVGGMNHFMLPEGAGDPGRYGSSAMARLIDELLELGAARASLQAKVFGGGQVMPGMGRLDVGERNTRFVLDHLRAQRIPVVAKDVLGIHPRKLCFMPGSGRALVKRLPATRAATRVGRARATAAGPIVRR